MKPRTLDASGSNFTDELRVLDLGAGNGMMGEVTKGYGVSRMLGVDIISEAKEACIRDRPSVYSDDSGFSRAVWELIFSEYLDVFHMERYRHRFSMEGTPLFYFALVAQKTAKIPESFLAEHGIEI